MSSVSFEEEEGGRSSSCKNELLEAIDLASASEEDEKRNNDSSTIANTAQEKKKKTKKKRSGVSKKLASQIIMTNPQIAEKVSAGMLLPSMRHVPLVDEGVLMQRALATRFPFYRPTVLPGMIRHAALQDEREDARRALLLKQRQQRHSTTTTGRKNSGAEQENKGSYQFTHQRSCAMCKTSGALRWARFWDSLLSSEMNARARIDAEEEKQRQGIHGDFTHATESRFMLALQLLEQQKQLRDVLRAKALLLFREEEDLRKRVHRDGIAALRAINRGCKRVKHEMEDRMRQEDIERAKKNDAVSSYDRLLAEHEMNTHEARHSFRVFQHFFDDEEYLRSEIWRDEQKSFTKMQFLLNSNLHKALDHERELHHMALYNAATEVDAAFATLRQDSILDPERVERSAIRAQMEDDYVASQRKTYQRLIDTTVVGREQSVRRAVEGSALSTLRALLASVAEQMLCEGLCNIEYQIIEEALQTHFANPLRACFRTTDREEGDGTSAKGTGCPPAQPHVSLDDIPTYLYDPFVLFPYTAALSLVQMNSMLSNDGDDDEYSGNEMAASDGESGYGSGTPSPKASSWAGSKKKKSKRKTLPDINETTQPLSPVLSSPSMRRVQSKVSPSSSSGATGSGSQRRVVLPRGRVRVGGGAMAMTTASSPTASMMSASGFQSQSGYDTYNYSSSSAFYSPEQSFASLRHMHRRFSLKKAAPGSSVYLPRPTQENEQSLQDQSLTSIPSLQSQFVAMVETEVRVKILAMEIESIWLLDELFCSFGTMDDVAAVTPSLIGEWVGELVWKSCVYPYFGLSSEHHLQKESGVAVVARAPPLLSPRLLSKQQSGTPSNNNKQQQQQQHQQHRPTSQASISPIAADGHVSPLIPYGRAFGLRDTPIDVVLCDDLSVLQRATMIGSRGGTGVASGGSASDIASRPTSMGSRMGSRNMLRKPVGSHDDVL